MPLKNLRQLKTIVSNSWSYEALAHSGQIYTQKSLIDCSTSSLYLLEKSRMDYRAAPLHLKIDSLVLGNFMTAFRTLIQCPRLSS